ncbi:MAG: amidohydrolase [Caulobacterales bacterium]|nr:amidohydrolase [Caulobacterales bacterium]
MIEGALVVDGVVHAFNFTRENWRFPFMEGVVRMLHGFTRNQVHPPADPRYRLTFDEFEGAFRLQPDLMEQVLFAESHTDIAVYHGVPMYGLFGDGSSPVWVAHEIKKRLPHRMAIYGDVSPLVDDPFAHIDRMVDEIGVIGLKFYPADVVEGRITPVRMNDEAAVWPLVEHARARGLKVIAVHKAVPLGPITKPYHAVDDMSEIVKAFPDMIFEIVHGGFAFAEETAELLAAHENVWVNLETNPCFAVNLADKFADMMEPLLATGATDRLIYATGATGSHPRPTLEAFWRFEMPKGYPVLDEAAKRAILGENFARLHGWDVEALKTACRNDQYGLENKTLTEPFAQIHARRDGTIPVPAE